MTTIYTKDEVIRWLDSLGAWSGELPKRGKALFIESPSLRAIWRIERVGFKETYRVTTIL